MSEKETNEETKFDSIEPDVSENSGQVGIGDERNHILSPIYVRLTHIWPNIDISLCFACQSCVAIGTESASMRRRMKARHHYIYRKD